MTPNCFDFVTSMTRKGEPVRMPDLNIALEQLSFMEFSLEGTTQGCVFANAGACTVYLSSPERFAVHKLIAYGERPIQERTKSAKDLLQAAAIVEWCLENGRENEPRTAWDHAAGRGRGLETTGVRGSSSAVEAGAQSGLCLRQIPIGADKYLNTKEKGARGALSCCV